MKPITLGRWSQVDISAVHLEDDTLLIILRLEVWKNTHGWLELWPNKQDTPKMPPSPLKNTWPHLSGAVNWRYMLIKNQGVWFSHWLLKWAIFAFPREYWHFRHVNSETRYLSIHHETVTLEPDMRYWVCSIRRHSPSPLILGKQLPLRLKMQPNHESVSTADTSGDNQKHEFKHHCQELNTSLFGICALNKYRGQK